MATETRTVTAMRAVARVRQGGARFQNGILELHDGRFTFRPIKGATLDVLLGDVHDVTLVTPSSWMLENPNKRFRCIIGGKQYLIILGPAIPDPVSDDRVKAAIRDASKREYRARIPRMRVILFRAALSMIGLGIPIVEAVHVTEVPDFVIFRENEPPPDAPRAQPAAVWRQALTGEPVPAAPLPTFSQRHPYVGVYIGALLLGIVLRELIHVGIEILPLIVIMVAVVVAIGLLLANAHRSRAWLVRLLEHEYKIPLGVRSSDVQNRIMLYVGAALLFIGLLLPTVSTPAWTHNYWQEHTPESIVLLLCAAGAAYLAYRALHRWAWVPGLVSLLVLAEAAQAERAHAEDLLSQFSFGETIMYWEWPCTLALFVGTSLLLLAPLIRSAQAHAVTASASRAAGGASVGDTAGSPR